MINVTKMENSFDVVINIVIIIISFGYNVLIYILLIIESDYVENVCIAVY